jgi:NADH-quinone oxidoreductase subunit N
VAVNEILQSIRESLAYVAPEILLTIGIIALIVLGLFKKVNSNLPVFITMIISAIAIWLVIGSPQTGVKLFYEMLLYDSFTTVLKILFNASVILTCIMVLQRNLVPNRTEFCILILTIVLGAHFLVMSSNLVMLFISFETISIASYVLAGFSNEKKSAEASLKYFLFGSAASALMLYGFSILYGITGSLYFTGSKYTMYLASADINAVLIGGLMVVGGMLFKISAAPMHFWTPDIYEGAPVPVIAFFSVVPKLAGMAVLIRFIISISIFGQSTINWQMILAIIAMLTIAVGNFAALAQTNLKRLMAYSSIAQSGFLLIATVALTNQSMRFFLFYATVYMLMNFLVFIYVESFEEKGFANVADYSGIGKNFSLPLILMFVGLISLTGLPPTAGFTGKLFLFSALWESYQLTGKSILLWLLIFGLLNTVVSLFYYLKIPYNAFLKSGQVAEKQNFLTLENLLGSILVLMILALFFLPGLLMGWINKVNFVL